MDISWWRFFVYKRWWRFFVDRWRWLFTDNRWRLLPDYRWSRCRYMNRLD